MKHSEICSKKSLKIFSKVYTVSVCGACKEKIITANLVTKHFLKEGPGNQICKYIQCPKCDEIEEIEKFKDIYSNMHLEPLFHHNRRLSSIKNEIGIKTIEQHKQTHYNTFKVYWSLLEILPQPII